MAKLLSCEEYQSYLNDPSKEGNFENMVNLFGFSPIIGHYHIPEDTNLYIEIKDKKIEDQGQKSWWSSNPSSISPGNCLQ